MIRFERVSKIWPSGAVAVADVDLEIPAGQFCVLLGPSGAGKSTLLRMVNGLISPSQGAVRVGSTTVSPATLPRVRRKVASIHQQFLLVGRLTVLQNVLTGILPDLGIVRAMLGLFPRIEQRRACQWLGQVGLDESMLHRRAADLSGGQQQRVAIARAFMARPEVLLADEPVASLDPATSEAILDLIRRNSRETGATVLCSLHQLDLAKRFADRIVAMRQGQIVFDGPPQLLTDDIAAEIYGDALASGDADCQTDEPRPQPGSGAAAPGGNGNAASPPRPPEQWRLRPAMGWKLLATLAALAVLLVFSASRTGIFSGIGELADAAIGALATLTGRPNESKVGQGAARFAAKAWPPVLARERAIDLLPEGFDPQRDVPALAYLTEKPTRDSSGRIVGTKVFLVEPVGYLMYVIGLMLQTIEIAVWGTLFALTLAIPLAYFGATNLTPNRLFYGMARALCSLSRSIPELVLALICVVLFGVGAFAGVLALGLHCAGFLGKFFADDSENTPRGPQDALICSGAGRLKVARYAVLPQILPQVLAYVQYIMERNVRTATVLGIVGAGGIGLELIGQWNLYQYGHATTILLVVFLTVVLLELITQRLRFKII